VLPREGVLLQSLVGEAANKVLLVAPFIKVGAFRQCVAALRSGVSLEVFTRWRPDEVAAGVSDLGVWHEVRKRPGARLYLSHRLHAKLYCSEVRCLVGSANVTSSALGWATPPNLELMLEASAQDPRLIEFERLLRLSAVRVDDELYERMSALVEEFQSNAPAICAAEDPVPWGLPTDSLPTASGAHNWIPELRQPEDLYLAYSGDLDALPGYARISAEADLAALSLPVGLNCQAFLGAVPLVLLQMPVVALVDELAQSPQRFGAVVDALRDEYGMQREEAVSAWQALMRWLLYFVPGRYERRVDRHTEMFMRCSETGRET